MIQNLNPVSFQKFGAILPDKDRAVTSPEQRICLKPQKIDIPVRRCAQQVELNPEPGLCVLSVSQDGEQFSHFYLDKFARLAPNIYFFLTPFGSDTTVQMSPNAETVSVIPQALDFRVRPQLVIPRLYTFFYQEREQGFVFSGEAHTMLELTYVDQGQLHSVADGQDLLLSAGDMVLYGANQWHMHYADIGVAPRYVTISFDAEGCDLTSLTNRKFKSPQKAIALLQQMLREQERADMYAEDMILSLLSQLLLTLLRESDSPAQPLKSPQCLNNENEIIRRAQQYISESVYQKLTVPLVAKNTDVSTSYLTALFHKHLQISPGEYIRRIKLQQSKQLIREGNMNFTEISTALQYSTIHHFSRQFKEKFGITPSEYAKSVK